MQTERGQNLKRAIECYQAALPLLQVTDPPIALAALVAQGAAQRELGFVQAARATWREALDFREMLLMTGHSPATRGKAAQLSEDLVPRLVLLEVELRLVTAAVATLERGRALGLRAALRLDYLWLSRMGDDFRVPILRARQRLERLRVAPPDGVSGSQPDRVRFWEAEIVEAEAALAAALAVARQAIGFTPPQSLDAAALTSLAPADGALVLFTIAPEGGAAFVLPQGQGGLVGETHTVQLPGATKQALRARLEGWDSGYRKLRTSGSLNGSLRPTDIVMANAALEPVLTWLWAEIMGPVLDRLRDIGLSAGAPLILLPQGDLALLPLHAACKESSEQRRYVLDDHVISYVPGGYMLRIAQERLAQRQAAGKIDERGCGKGLFGAFNPMQGTRFALPLLSETRCQRCIEYSNSRDTPRIVASVRKKRVTIKWRRRWRMYYSERLDMAMCTLPAMAHLTRSIRPPRGYSWRATGTCR